MKINNKEIEISNPDKLIYPDDNFSKMDMVEYYEKIADYMIPLINNRPVMLQRFPDGINKSGFFQKERPDYFPDWIRYKSVEKKEGGEITHVMCDSKETLVYLANQGTVTVHVWLSNADKPKHPDRIILDLDPPGNFESIQDALPELKKYLEKTGLRTFLMTTGSKGVHLIIPVQPDATYGKIRNTIDTLVEDIIDSTSGHFTDKQMKEKRGDKIYLDSQRNNYAQTGVAPYSLRPLKNAPVATPVSWEESLDQDFSPRKYHMKNIFKRLSKVDNPWSSLNNKTICDKNTEILTQFQ